MCPRRIIGTENKSAINEPWGSRKHPHTRQKCIRDSSSNRWELKFPITQRHAGLVFDPRIWFWSDHPALVDGPPVWFLLAQLSPSTLQGFWSETWLRSLSYLRWTQISLGSNGKTLYASITLKSTHNHSSFITDHMERASMSHLHILSSKTLLPARTVGCYTPPCLLQAFYQNSCGSCSTE